jgi:hypothetical protein
MEKSDMTDLSRMFENGQFKRLGLRKYLGEVDGRKIGVVLATKNAGFDSPALNKMENDSLLRAKRDGRIDEADVVAAKVNGADVPRFLGQIDAEQLAAKLVNEVPRIGRYGEFFVLNPAIGFPMLTIDDDEPF